MYIKIIQVYSSIILILYNKNNGFMKIIKESCYNQLINKRKLILLEF